jgi:hypothetical protein
VKAAPLAIAIALVLIVGAATLCGCQEIQSALGGAPPPDAGGPPSGPSLGRSIQGIPILAGAEVAYAGNFESDYQIELRSRAATVVDAMRYYDATLRHQGWQLVPPVPDGLAQVVRGTRDGRMVTVRYEPREVGVSIQFLLVSAPALERPDVYAPIGDLAPPVPVDGGVAEPDGGSAPSAGPSLPDGVPLPTGYRLSSNRGLGGGSWEVVLEVDASADQALGRLTIEMSEMGWRFGAAGARAPVATPSPDGTVVGSRAGVTVTISATEATRATGGLSARLRLVGSPNPR